MKVKLAAFLLTLALLAGLPPAPGQVPQRYFKGPGQASRRTTDHYLLKEASPSAKFSPRPPTKDS